jgi:hypothetical protein
MKKIQPSDLNTPHITASHNLETIVEDHHSRYRGMAVAIAFLLFFGTAWFFVPLSEHAVSGVILVLLLIFALLLLVASINLWVLSRKTPKEPHESKPHHASSRKKMNKIFGLVFGIEMLLIAVVAGILPPLGLAEYVLPCIAIIVGLHFVPLARLFRRPCYYVTATLALAIGAISIFTISPVFLQDFVGFSMGAILWGTASWILVTSKRSREVSR